MEDRVFKAYVGVLRANEVATVRMRVSGSIEMVRRSAAGQFWCRFDGTDPVAGEHDNFLVVKSRRFMTNKPLVTVKLVSTTDLEISIEGAIF